MRPRRSYWNLALAAAITIPVWINWVHMRDADSAPLCFGRPATVVGTSRADNITISNGDSFQVVVTYGGDDIVTVNSFEGTLVCTGKGNDVIYGSDTVDGGVGFDKATAGICYTGSYERVERVDVSVLDIESERCK